MHNEKYEMWLNSPYVDENLKEELKGIERIDSEIEDRFYKELEFGTGGMRGKIGAGTNRINSVTVAKATQGIANYLIEKYINEEISAAIAYDSRNMSKEFAQKAACVFAANNINVYLFDSLRPTPELSYAVRYFNCKAGIVITASHNPPEYNGYKVYDEFGGQVVQDANKIIEKINEVRLEQIKLSELEGNEKIQLIGNDVDTSYINEIKKLNIDLGIPATFREAGIDEKEFLDKVDMLADRAFEDQCTTANPRLPLVSELKQILLDSYYGNNI